MASLIHEGTGTGKGREGEQDVELAMKFEPYPLEEPSASHGLIANQADVSAARSASAPAVSEASLDHGCHAWPLQSCRICSEWP